MGLTRTGWLRLALVGVLALALAPLALGDDGDDDDDGGSRPNPPQLTAAREAAGSLEISGSFTGSPNRPYVLDFYRSSVCGSSTKTHLGSTTVTTGAGGSVTFSVTFPAVGSGRYVAATATDKYGRKSSLSKCVTITQTLPFVVNSRADPGTGGCDPAECTLREAIAAANARTGPDTITLAIGSGPVTIPIASPLPSIAASLVLDGTAQPGYSGTALVRLDGAAAGASANGLVLAGDNVTVKGLAIEGFARAGILVAGSTGTVQGNTIASNGGDGIEVAPQSQRGRFVDNKIDGNGGLGIDLGNDGVTQNDEGDGDTGANALQNFPVLTSAVQTGGTLTVEGMLTSAPNTTYAVELFSSPACDESGYGEGARPLLRLPEVVTDEGGSASFGPVPIEFAGPAGEAVTATATSPSGDTSEFSACTAVTERTTLVVNSPADPGEGGCDLEECTLREAIEASNASAARNTIAFALPEPPFVIQPTSALPATTDPVTIDGTTQIGDSPFSTPVVVVNGALAGEASGLTIAGGDSEVRGLVVNGFGSYAGIVLREGDRNVIAGNYVGTSGPGETPAGTTAEPNGVGIVVEASSTQNRIGGGPADDRNVISGNTFDGIALETGEYTESPGDNAVLGNYVGVDATGEEALPNGRGIRVAGSANTVGPGNVVSGNTGVGLELSSNATASVVRGTLIGVDVNGSREPNDIGLFLDGADGNAIGGTGEGDGNVIGASRDVNLDLDSASQNTVAGNWIGTDPSGTADLGAVNSGVEVTGASAENTLGPDNVIAFNGSSFSGVTITGGEATGNQLTRNSIYDNVGLGIDLGADGVTSNDAGDADAGPNGRQNFPVVAAAASVSGTLFVQGRLSSRGDREYRLELFSNPECDPSGHGEGKRFLSATTVSASSGPVPFSLSLETEVAVGAMVTATATDLSTGSTSEFSACRTVTSAAEPPDATAIVTADADSVPAGAGQVRYADVPPTELLAANTASSRESAPINDVPINDVPLASPINDVPINDVGFPTVAGQLGDVTLSSIPLLRPGGWPAVLAGTALDGRPLQTVTLKQAYELSPLPPELQPGNGAAITIGQLDLSQSPLGGLPSSVLLLGPTLLEDLGLPLAEWCRLFSAPPIGCSTPSSLQSSSLLSASVSGAPINDVPINDVPINDVDLSRAPINDVPINDVELRNSPINDVPINDVPINDVPINDVPINDVLANGSPINDVPINDVSNPQQILNCSLVDCVAPTSATLRDALAAGAFLAGVTLGDLRAHVAPGNFPYSLGDIGAWGDLTIGELVASLPPGANITLADVLVLVLGPELFGWEQLDLGSIALQRFATDAPLAGFNADFRLTSTTNTGAFASTVRVTLPDGFLYEPGSSVLKQVAPAGPDSPLDDPLVDGQALTYQLDAVIGTEYRIELDARPSITLGPVAAGGSLTPLGGATAVSPPAPVTVGDTFEPNPSSAPHPIGDDSFYLSYVTSKDDLDYFSFAVPAAGSRVTFTLSHVPVGADYDLVVYGPRGAQLRPEIPGTPLLDGPPLEDRGATLTHVVDALPPETLDDAQLEDLPLLGVSANRGQEDDAVLVLSGGEPGVYTVQISGYNRTSSPRPYMLRAQVDPPRVPAPCVPRSFPNTGVAGVMPALPAGLNTVFLVNKEQLEKTYGPAAATVFAALQANQATLQGLGFPSAVIPVEAGAGVPAAYSAWNACPSDPRAANDVVRAIGAVLDGIRAQRPTLKYVVILGGDDIVPQARLSDFTTLANEYEFADTFGPSTALGGALRHSTYLSDDPYGDVDPVPYLNRQLHVPDLALGRLVEEPVDIVAALNRFVVSAGRLDPSSSFTSGYDFLSDGAERVNAAFAAKVGAANAATLINNSWTRADFLAGVLPTAGLAGLNGHADPSRLQPAAGLPLVDTADFAAANLANRVLFSMGCHAGLSVNDVFITGNDDDWAQTFAERGAASWTANTGYGYGDTVVNAYGELLNGLFAENLVAGTMRAGEALIYAKHEYLAQTGVFGVFDEKSMGELTFYGLPMYSVGAVAPLASAAAEAALVDPATGLEADSFSVIPSFTEVSTPRGTYLRGDDGVQVSHLRPLQPKMFSALAGTDAHGALITDLTSFDQSGVDPVFARPLFDDSANEPELAFDDVVFPSKLQSVRTFKTVGGTRQRLVLVTGQFFGDGVLDDLGIGIQRRHTRIGGLVYRSNSGDFVAPTIGRIEAQHVAGTAAFSVDVTDRTASGPGQVARVLVGFRDGSSPDWTFVDLVETASGTWTGGAPAAGAQIEYFVQAVDVGAGNVAVSTNKGSNYEALPAPGPPTGGLDPDVSGEQGQNGWFTGAVEVSVAAPDGVVVEISVDDGRYERRTSVTVAGDGIHTVRVRASNGGTATVFVPIDGTPPEIRITEPADGAVYALDSEVLADYACLDTGSGAVSCDGTVADGAAIDTSSPGLKSFTVESVDAAGQAGTKTVTYRVARRSIVFSSTRTGKGDIYTMSEAGEAPLRLTSDEGIDAEPVWSPDRTQIAFTSTRHGNVEIHVMDADGSNVRRLTTNAAIDSSPAWSPDGSKIAFASNRTGNQFDIFVMAVSGAGVTRLTTDKRDDLVPAWAPNGEKIAFTSTRSGGSDVYVMNANGSAQTRLTTSAAHDTEPDWSPDGSKIVFSTNGHGSLNFELYVMNTDGGEQTRLTANVAADGTPAWSPDGTSIVFTSTRDGNLELYVMNANGSGQTRLTMNRETDTTPDW